MGGTRPLPFFQFRDSREDGRRPSNVFYDPGISPPLFWMCATNASSVIRRFAKKKSSVLLVQHQSVDVDTILFIA